MILLNEKNTVKMAIENWIAKYGLTRTYGFDKRGRKVGEELSKLDLEIATPSEVNEIIGNDDWCHEFSCDECGHIGWDIIHLKYNLCHNLDDNCSFYICKECLIKAIDLVKKG